VVGLEDPPGAVPVNHQTMTKAEWEKLAEEYDQALLVTVRLPNGDEHGREN